MESKFKVGDRVRPNKDWHDIYDRSDVGTVVFIKNGEIWVEHDKGNAYKHNLSGMCEDGYGWIYNDIMLEVFELKIRGTKLARKIYQNKIVREEEGFIYVQG